VSELCENRIVRFLPDFSFALYSLVVLPVDQLAQKAPLPRIRNLLDNRHSYLRFRLCQLLSRLRESARHQLVQRAELGRYWQRLGQAIQLYTAFLITLESNP
jgi:hypothetical protein